MIEQILLRIARRGPALARLLPSDTSVAPSEYEHSDALPFPRRKTEADAPDSLPHALNVMPFWDAAKNSHYSSGTPQERARALPPAFVNYAMVHAMIGSVIWSERKYFQKNIVHIVTRNGDVVAAVYPGERTVAVRKRPHDAAPGMLSIKELPASARRFEGDEDSNFETSTIHMLLWYYGQVVPQAVEDLPSELLRGKILLRKLPLVAPSALGMQHLHLIHLFSAGPLYLQSLFELLSAESLKSICADLTSLFLTGCLVSTEKIGRPA